MPRWLVGNLTLHLTSTALCAAAYAGNLEELKRMKALGADINSGDYDARTVWRHFNEERILMNVGYPSRSSERAH